MRVSSRCYAVTGLGYSAPWCVNAGFIVGEAVTLVVDTGGNTAAAQTIHGYACAAKPGNEVRVINTEKHFDHIGGNGFFREQGIDVWGHEGIVRTPLEFEAEVAEFSAAIDNAARRERGEARAFFHATRVVNPNCQLRGNGSFDLGECAAEIVPTPGHTPTNVSVWVPEDGVLFTGDCVVREYLPNLDAGTPEEWQMWLGSLERVERFRPSVIVPGHGPVARGDEVRAAIETVRGVLREAIARGCSPTAGRQA